MQVGKFARPLFGFGVGGEDAPDGRHGESAEADGAFKGGTHVVTLVLGDQGQELLGLEFALDLLGQEAVEELQGDRAEFTEALAQESCPVDGIVHRMMRLDQLPQAGLGAGHERMPGDFLQADRVDDDFALGDAHGEDLADVREGHGIKIASMREVAIDADMAIDDLSGVKVAGRQWQQVRLLAMVTLERRFLEVAQDANIDDIRQPLCRHLVEMLQGVEGAAVEQADFGEVELPLAFSLRLSRQLHAMTRLRPKPFV